MKGIKHTAYEIHLYLEEGTSPVALGALLSILEDREIVMDVEEDFDVGLFNVRCDNKEQLLMAIECIEKAGYRL